MKTILTAIILSASSVLTTTLVEARQIYADLPDSIDKHAKYVFYSHGYIVEGTNPKPVDTRFGWGVYDFPAIKDALSDPSYHLIAHHRSKNTDPFEYAYTLNGQVRTLVEQGVKPSNITIMGFSRGAFITGVASDKLSDLGVNTIILAGCGRLVWKKHTDVKVYGHVLSIYEKTDKSNSCSALAEKSTSVKSFTELEINTGLSHGAFYRPRPEWVTPVKAWIKSQR
ncbi:alpha/beta hydrolase [Pseudoalteromonas sp. MMG013]|nr:alpha/beta hydrolase [Pseudoalteromonas sp. MMG005]MBQ4860537.1 alpha/beta hydrolase [Pseudoalteromonas sp. MMG013]